MAKLDEAKAVEIRKRYANGGVSLNDLAARYGVSKKTVLNIIHRRIWTHV